MYDIGSLALVNLLPTPVAAGFTVTANGTGVDAKDFVGIGALVLDFSAGTGTAPTLNVKIQDSDDNTTFADLATPVAFAQVGAGASQQRLALNMDAARRYIRVVSTIGGTTPAFIGSVNLLGRKQVMP